VPDLGDGAVLIVGKGGDIERDAARTVALVDDLFNCGALEMAFLSRAFDSVSPPSRAAMLSSRMILVKTLPRLASVAAFLCLIEAHLECPDIVNSLLNTGRF